MQLRGPLCVGVAFRRDQYIALDAKQSLANFMVDRWPVEALFAQFIDDLLLRVRGQHRNVRAFGEMVGVIWAEGQCGPTVRLEHMWTRFDATNTGVASDRRNTPAGNSVSDAKSE